MSFVTCSNCGGGGGKGVYFERTRPCDFCGGQGGFMCNVATDTHRDRLALLIGSFTLHRDDRGEERQVLHDAFAGDYDERTEAVYMLVDEILAEISVQAVERAALRQASGGTDAA